MEVPWRVAVDSEDTSAVFEPAAAGDGGALFVCAHGAGGHMADRGILRVAQALRARGFDLVRFNFPYRERGSRTPDTMERLKACVAAVVSHARNELRPRTLIVGGRSMGGRAASMLAADGLACDGLLLLAYPLHPAGKPDALRAAHLPRIQVPVLCFNGTRDALCRRDLMEQVLTTVSTPWQMHWLEGADHSFHVLKSSGRTDGEVLNEIGDASQAWLSGLRR
jgi:uncharacterized protein